MVCLDTSFIADPNRKDAGAITKLREFIKKREKLVTTVINVAELYKGVYGYYNPENIANIIPMIEIRSGRSP